MFSSNPGTQVRYFLQPVRPSMCVYIYKHTHVYIIYKSVPTVYFLGVWIDWTIYFTVICICCIYIYIYIYISTHTYYIHICTHIYMHIYIYIYVRHQFMICSYVIMHLACYIHFDTFRITLHFSTLHSITFHDIT